MTATYKIEPLSMDLFRHYFSMSDKELVQHGAKFVTADENPGYPCRVSLQDAEVGEKLLAINYLHHDVNSPYRASGPIFIREIAKTAHIENDQFPVMLKHRLLSIRAYNSHNMMINASVVDGEKLDEEIKSHFADQNVDYLHVHNAGPGCFSCAVNRA